MKQAAPLLLVLVLLVGGIIAVLKVGQPADKNTSQELAQEESAFASAPREPWPHESGDVPAQERALFGALDNNFRYVIVPNPEPPKRVSLRLHVDAGSLHEADDQRGLAHFLEHMAFNGSKNFPDSKDLIPQMQRLGISFGAHANAYTSFDETVYMLDLPNLAEPTLDLAFTVMRDFADGLLLKEEEIEKERGVILSEKNSRDSVDRRIMEQQFQFLLPDSLITHRMPIGTEEVISNAPRERFTHFYENYYTPSKMTFVVVGDIDPATMEETIKNHFAPLKNPAQAGAKPNLGEFPSGQGFQAAIFTDPEVSTDELALLQISAATPEVDSEAKRIRELPLSIAHAILNRRFSILAKEEGSPILAGSASRGVWFQTLEFGSIDLTPSEGRWEDAVPVLEQEFRRALEFGFTQAEFKEISAKTLNIYEQAVKQEPTRQSPGIAMQLIRSINDLASFSSPETNLEILKKGLSELTPEDCHKAFVEFWKTPDLSLILTTTQKTEETKPRLLSLYEESRSSAIEAPVESELLPFAYSGFGDAGTIVAEHTIEDLDATQLLLSNQVRVNFKRTDFEKGSIRLLARFGSGQLTQPANQPGLQNLASALLNGGGLGAHSADDLQRILAGRTVGAAFGIGEDSLTLSGSTTSEDLELQLQLMCAYLTDPGFREEALRQYQKGLPDLYDKLKHDLGGAQAQLSQWLHSDDHRFALPTLEEALAYGISDVQDWVLPQIKQDYLELTIVGDFEPTLLKGHLLKTFGALPLRASSELAYEELRQLTYRDTPDQIKFTYESKIPRAAAMTFWKTPGVGEDIGLARRLNLVASILRDRMREKIREEIGATYSPAAAASLSTVFPNYGNILGYAVAKPEDVTRINQITLELAETFAKDGATEDEFDRALKPLQSELEQTLRQNGYWLNTVLSRSQAQPRYLDWARERDADYASVTLDEVNSLAAQYLVPSNAIQASLAPEK